MKTAIIYATKHGTTEKCVAILAKKITGPVDVTNLKKDQAHDLTQYDKVIIGGSIYVGQIQKEIKDFCSKNMAVLQNKRLGLFICCMQQGDQAMTQLDNSFPRELQDVAVTRESFGGEFVFKKMNFLERFIVKKVAKTDRDTSFLAEEKIEQFARSINQG